MYINKLFITLALMMSTTSVYGMEPEKKLFPISSPQTYHEISKLFAEVSGNKDNSFPEIMQHIFSFQCKTSGIDCTKLPLEIEQSCKSPNMLIEYIKKMITAYGYDVSASLFKKYFPHETTSLCDIKDGTGCTTLHKVIHCSNRIEIAKLLLHATGDKKIEFLFVQDRFGCTALHDAIRYNQATLAKVLLDGAGDKALTLFNVKKTTSYEPHHSREIRKLREEITLKFLPQQQ